MNAIISLSDRAHIVVYVDGSVGLETFVLDSGKTRHMTGAVHLTLVEAKRLRQELPHIRLPRDEE
jgi:hypothetical protein